MTRIYKKHTFDERLLCVERYLSGESARSIERELGIHHNGVLLYAAKYERFGAEGLCKQPNVRPTYALKCR